MREHNEIHHRSDECHADVYLMVSQVRFGAQIPSPLIRVGTALQSFQLLITG